MGRLLEGLTYVVYSSLVGRNCAEQEDPPRGRAVLAVTKGSGL